MASVDLSWQEENDRQLALKLHNTNFDDFDFDHTESAFAKQQAMAWARLKKSTDFKAQPIEVNKRRRREDNATALENLRRELQQEKLDKLNKLREYREKEKIEEAKKRSKHETQLIDWFNADYQTKNLLIEEVIRCIYYGDQDQLKQLLATGILPFVRDEDGRGPLEMALIRGDLKMFDFLLHSGATETNVDNWGDSLDNYAFKYRHYALRSTIDQFSQVMQTFVSAKHERLGQDSSIQKFFFRDPLCDLKLIPLLNSFIDKQVDFATQHFDSSVHL